MSDMHLVLHGLAIKKHGSADAVAGIMGLKTKLVRDLLDQAVSQRRVAEANGAYVLTPLAGVALQGDYSRVHADLRSSASFAAAYERFEVVNAELKQLMTDWQTLDELPPFRTEVQTENARTIITRNTSPDLHFDRSINPYRGCEHGCIYCYARPTHAYMGLSAGMDFETKLFAKPGAAKLLKLALSKKGYEAKTIVMGTNTDPYQPIEKKWRITREILEVLEQANHPVAIVTKSHLVTRDIDILERMAEKQLVKVALSVTTLDRRLARAMEPRAATPGLRLKAIHQLSQAGIPCSVMIGPVIPALSDHEIERILESAKSAGADEAGYILLRLPEIGRAHV